MTLATWGGVTDHNFPVRGVQVFRWFYLFWWRNCKFDLSAWVTDINIPRYTLYIYCSGYQSLKVSKWLVIPCSYDERLHYFIGEFTWRDLVTWSWMTWVWTFHMCRKDVETGGTKTAALRTAVFLDICEKLGGSVQTPPARRGLTGRQKQCELFSK